MFVGRKKELETLCRLHDSQKFEFAVIYGRRRVGKTALIRRFIENKKAIYFMGVESNEKQNLENFSKSIFDFSSGMNLGFSFSSFQAALEYVFVLSQKERIVLAIDEYPYVARTSKSLASTLQLLIDKYKDSSKLMLILCGSSMSYMEDNVLAYKAPLYGRRTAQIKLLPFDFEQSCKYFPSFSGQDKAIAYGLVGGTPQYLLQIDDSLSIEENIKRLYLDPSSSLFEEPLNLLKQEVREPAVYNAIIGAIATGSSKMSEISGKVGESTATCSAYLNNLVSLGIIKKETPYGEKASKKSIYSLTDNMFRFWYRFVPDNNSIIAMGATDLAFERIKPFINDYMGKIFEEICTQYLWKLLLCGKSPVLFSSLGRWWGNDPKRKEQTEIDIMGAEGKEKALFAECKWTNEKLDSSVAEKLIERSELFSFSKKELFLFSKSGFTQGCIQKASLLENVRLVTYDDILNFLQ